VSYIPGDSRHRPERTEVFTRDLAAAAARIHAFTPYRSNFPPGGFFGKDELRTFVLTFEEKVAASGDELTRAVYDTLLALRDHVEWPAPCLIHDDFWPGNTVWHRGRLAAVIDWGEAKLGDPRTDVAQCQLELSITLDLAAGDAFVAAYDEIAKPLPQLWYFGLFRGLLALFNLDGWLVGYEDAGVSLDPALARLNLRRYLERALKESAAFAS